LTAAPAAGESGRAVGGIQGVGCSGRSMSEVAASLAQLFMLTQPERRPRRQLTIASARGPNSSSCRLSPDILLATANPIPSLLDHRTRIQPRRPRADVGAR